MSCFFSCFGAKHKLDFQPPLTTTKEQEIIPRVSRNQLSDLFLSQELEEISCDEKSAQPESGVDIQCCNDKVVDFNTLPDHTWTPSAKASHSVEGLDGQEASPISCISDPPSASMNSVSTNTKSNTSESIQKLKNEPASSQKDLLVQGSVFSSLNQVPRKKAGNKVNIQANLAANGRTGRSPRDRSILRTVTAQWNGEVDPSHDPLKWWDGNGIPNSTNKYREDQIVSWDVTPFEERLEKALSEANSIAQRKHITYNAFEDETDTAVSQLQSLPQQKSVVSF